MSVITRDATTGPRRRIAIAGGLAAALIALTGSLLAWDIDRSPDTVASFDASSATTAPSTTSPPPTTVTPTTTAATTTVPTTSTTLPAPTTTLAMQLTQPIAPPQDARAPEDLGEIGRISIPKIGLDSPMLEGIRLTTLDRGPGHWPGSAMPGQIGNVVVAGHRTSHNAEFRHLDRLEPGDEVVFDTEAGTSVYVVTRTHIVGPEALWIVDPTDTPTATLFACHPPGSTAQRIVVDLELAS